MFELRARDAEISRLRLRCFQLGFRLRDVFIRHDAGLKTNARELELLLISLDRRVKQTLLSIERAKLVVIKRELSLDAQTHVLQIGGAGLCLGSARDDGVADASPEVRLPRGVKRQRVVYIHASC